MFAGFKSLIMNFDFLKKIVLFFSVFISFSLSAQVKMDTNYVLPAGEDIHYRIYYKLGNLWVYAAIANFKTDTLTYQGKKAYKLYVEAFTRKKYNWIYSLEDHYTSITDCKTFLPLKFEKYNIEKGITYHNIYHFDWNKKEVEMFISRSDQKDTTIKKKLPDFVTDSYSAVQYLRTWDFSALKKGQHVAFETILDGKIFSQEIIYHGKEVVLDKDGNEVSSFKLEAPIKNSSFFDKHQGVFVWISDNKDRWIVKVSAKILVGSIVVFLDEPGLISFDRH